MRFRNFGVLAVLAVPTMSFFLVSQASADEIRVVAPPTYVLSFPEGGPRFHVTRDMTAGSLVFRAAEGTVVTKAPVVTLRDVSSPKGIVLTAVAADKGSWRVSHDLLKAEKFDGTFAVVVADQTYTAPLVLVPVRTARHGGYLLRVADCGTQVEVIHDLTKGTVTVYCADDVKVTEALVLVLNEPKDAGQVKFVGVTGQPGAWRATHAALKTTTVDGTLRVTVDGKACETPLSFYGTHGGRIVRVVGGPRFEVVQDPKNGYLLYALDETVDGKAYVIENPKITWPTSEGPQTVTMQPVENQPRTWRLVGAEGSLREPGDARLSFTLFGKTLETGLGLSGTGISLR